jgi:hypothetical protein
LADWRRGGSGTVRPILWTYVLGIVAVLVGVTGLIAPAMVRPVYTGWMIVAFPIGWTVSKVALGLMFFLVFMPVGLVFR